MTSRLTCPVSIAGTSHVQLGHGSGGRLTARLVRERFVSRFSNTFLDQLGDGAVVPLDGTEIVISTDSFVVSPLEFPGGNIGHLAVHGTLNDLAVMGATPRYLSAGFILEEGLAFDVLDRVLDAMTAAARTAGVEIVTGDTKVVERGKADGMFVNTTGIGTVHANFRPGPASARPGDAVLVSGSIGRHGMAIMAVREGFEFESEITSDTANLTPLVSRLRQEVGPAVRTLRDVTRGGLASVLNEIAVASRVGIALQEHRVPVDGPVYAACEMLGLDPLYVANEGVLVAIVAPESAERALAAMRADHAGVGACTIGHVTCGHPSMVVLETGLGGTRVVDMLPGDQLPRIC